MCDYSLMHVRSRSAQVGDKLVTKTFGSGSTGFVEFGGDGEVAVCCLSGTEIAFEVEPNGGWTGGFLVKAWKAKHKVAVFRQINKDEAYRHHDALEFPDGEVKLLTQIAAGTRATVLQLPAAPKNEAEAKEQERLEVVA